MKVRELMIKNVITCAKDDPIHDVARKMVDHNIGMLIVLEDNTSQKPAGVLSDRDLITEILLKHLNPQESTAEQAMTKELISVSPESDINEAVKIMDKNKIKRLVVIDDLQNLVGIISKADLIKQFLNIRKQLVEFSDGI